MSLKDYESRFEKHPARTTFRVLVIGFFILVGVSVLGWGVSMLLYAPQQAGRVLKKTFDADNVIANYEWFYDTYRQFDARVGQIHSHEKAMEAARADGSKSSDLDRYRVEIEGMRQSCRDMAARYNANSAKINRRIFKGTGTPEELSTEQCEG